MRVMHDEDKTGEWGFSVHEDKASQACLAQPRLEHVVCHSAFWPSVVAVAAGCGWRWWLLVVAWGKLPPYFHHELL